MSYLLKLIQDNCSRSLRALTGESSTDGFVVDDVIITTLNDLPQNDIFKVLVVNVHGKTYFKLFK